MPLAGAATTCSCWGGMTTVPGNDSSDSARSCSMAMLVMPAALICRSSSRRTISELAFATLDESDTVTNIASAFRLAPALLGIEIAFISVASLQLLRHRSSFPAHGASSVSIVDLGVRLNDLRLWKTHRDQPYQPDHLRFVRMNVPIRCSHPLG